MVRCAFTLAYRALFDKTFHIWLYGLWQIFLLFIFRFREIVAMNSKLRTKEELQVVVRASSLMLKAHAGQFREGGEARTDHAQEVYAILTQEMQIEDPQTRAAALLHDVVKCTAVMASDIRAEFGDEIAGMVVAVTKPDLPKASIDLIRHLHFEQLKGASDGAKCIKAANSIRNLRTMASRDAAWQKDYLYEVLLLSEALVGFSQHAFLVEEMRIQYKRVFTKPVGPVTGSSKKGKEYLDE